VTKSHRKRARDTGPVRGVKTEKKITPTARETLKKNPTAKGEGNSLAGTLGGQRGFGEATGRRV